AIYGGHISGRRLRGVKVNPIFQENEGSRDACDTQSEGGVPVGEIQIEMYESLPRHRSVRHTLSAPVMVIGKTRSTGVLPKQSDTVKNDNNTKHKSETENSLKNKGSKKQKKQLSRQRRYEASSDDPDVIELADSSLPSSSNSSPSSSFYSSERSNKDTGWSRGNRPFSQRYYLSTLSERTVSADSTAADQSTQAVCEEEDSGMSSYGQSQTEHIYNNALYISETLGQPTVHSLDLMNNNEMSMPDQMLQHYNAESLRMSRLRAEVLRNENYVEEFSRNPNTLRPEDFIVCDTLSLRAVFSLSSSSSIDSDYKNLESKLANKIHCQCNGRPTLKCECGRAALQKLFREKRDGLQNGSMEDNLQTLDAGQLLKNQVNLNDASSPCLQPAKGSQKKLLALHALGHAEGKFVTFSDDTIFNEDNRVTYVKESITRSAFHLHLDDKEAGYDNNGFLTDDEKALKLKDKNSSNKLNSQGSIVLSVWLKKADCGFEYDPDIDYESDKTVDIGFMDVVCEYCQAKRWKCESPGLCCNGGKVLLTSSPELPDLLHGLVHGEHPQSEHFLNNIRKYNSAFQMTSFGATQVVEGHFMPSFKVQGQVYHLIGSLLPLPTEQHKFLQIYFVGDDEKEAQLRCANVSGLNTPLVHQLQTMLHDCNTYIKDFHYAIDSISEEDKDFHVVIHADKKPSNAHKGRYNKPAVREVSSLNAPAYLHAYLMGFHQETKTPEGTPSEEKRAAPVSIEAIGGITTDDPAFDTIGEATEEDFEYYRRRRRKKKSCGNSEDGSVEAWTKRTNRCRKIKISVVVVTVIIGIVVAIALAIHFGAPAAGNSSLTSEQTQEPGSSFSRILF
ncbi:ATP-dependent DNA helicase PIF6, partial [Biomphalaria pfeifferi]